MFLYYEVCGKGIVKSRSTSFQEILKLFGLTRYETAVYLELMKNGPLTAGDVAELAGVPQPKVYSVLRGLQNSGYVLVTGGTPSLYEAEHPGYLLRVKLADLRKNVESIVEAVEQEYEVRKDMKRKRLHDAWTMYGELAITTKLLELLDNASKTFVGFVHYLDWTTEEEVIKILKKVRDSGVEIKLIAPKVPRVTEDLGIFKIASGAQVKLVDKKNSLKNMFVVVDEEFLLLAFRRGKDIDVRDYVGVFIRNEETAAIYQSLFQKNWTNLVG
jgi:sugar-specific transcriptional regulator TrmB